MNSASLGSAFRSTVAFHGPRLVALLLFAVTALQAQETYLFTTLAGKAQVGAFDGPRLEAQFTGPVGVAVDANDNIYVADAGNQTIRKITPAGMVTTIAGLTGYVGSADGTGTSARFYSPSAIAVDGAGNLYVADVGNRTIRKITPAGVVTTLAGMPGQLGSITDGTGSAARFNWISHLAVDPSGTIYVSDQHAIRKVTADGVVTTFAGGNFPGNADGTGAAATFRSPAGLTVDPSGNVYVCDRVNQMIRKITPAGVVTTLAGSATLIGPVDGLGSVARFYNPMGIVWDNTAGVLYVSESNGGQRIRRVTTDGLVTSLAGTWGVPGNADGTGTAAGFQSPNGLGVDSAGNVYVGDVGNMAIRKMTSGGVVTSYAGVRNSAGSADGTGSAARFSSPVGAVTDSIGNIYVADAGNSTIRRITQAGVVTTWAGTAGMIGSTDATGSAARFSAPRSLAIDSSDNLYVADYGNSKIRRISPNAEVTTFAAVSGINAVAVDSQGYVTAVNSSSVWRVTPAGVATQLAGTSSYGSADGTGSAASFFICQGVAVDQAGNAYVTDAANNKIRKVTPAGVVTTFAGSQSPGSVDGSAAVARFSYPYGIATDLLGNLYVTDGSILIRKISPSGDVTTIGGGSGYLGSYDGAGTFARFMTPRGIGVDAAGVLYITDTGNNLLRKGVLHPAPLILVHPSSQSAAMGSAVMLGVTATGTAPLGYQWRKDGVNIPGATSVTYTIPNSTAGDAGSYTVVVTNAYGSATSDPAILATFIVPPSAAVISFTVE